MDHTEALLALGQASIEEDRDNDQPAASEPNNHAELLRCRLD